MIEVSDERFEELVEQGLDRIPDEFLRHLTNVVILIGEYNERSPHILGLYEGVALTRKTANHTGHLPDTITIYKNALEDHCNSEEELVHQVAVTVIHEVGHHFGLDDADQYRTAHCPNGLPPGSKTTNWQFAM